MNKWLVDFRVMRCYNSRRERETNENERSELNLSLSYWEIRSRSQQASVTPKEQELDWRRKDWK